MRETHSAPAMCSRDIGEDEFKTLIALGEDIHSKRFDGHVFGIRNAWQRRITAPAAPL